MSSINENSKPTNVTSSMTNSVSNLAVEKYPTGHTVAVGSHKVEVVRYLTEGGFAQIYVVKFIELLNEFNANAHNSELKVGDLACLKRVMVHDENGLNEMRNEVDVMKLLKDKANVVQYFDSNATRNQTKSGGFEVLLLMEFCPNKSLLDFMNQRLTTKLSEHEVLKIMYDVSVGIAQLHYLETPLIHRDIKIENVLVDSQNNFKLCDFGSTTKCHSVPTSPQDISNLSQDIYVHTTPQYRSPEMIDLYRYLAVNEKSDIWALGIFLFKLLFYTTPFERTGQFAILHSKYDIPQCNYSPQLINLIVIMLCENPYMRPNIYQVVTGVCSILNVEIPIQDKYGTGPYDFDKFIAYQKKSHLLGQRLISHATGSSVDNSDVNDGAINDVFLAYYDLVPRFQETTSSVDISTKLQVARAKSIASEERLSRHTTVTVDSNKSGSSAAGVLNHPDFKTITDGSNNYPTTSSNNANSQFNYSNNNTNSNTNPYKSMSGQNNYIQPRKHEQLDYYNDNTNHFTASNSELVSKPQRQKSSSSYNSSGKSAVMSDTDGNAITQTVNHEQEQASTIGKQHKSNNPFPNINNERQERNIFQSNNNRVVNALVEPTIFGSQQEISQNHHTVSQHIPAPFQNPGSLPLNCDVQPAQPSSQQYGLPELPIQPNGFHNENHRNPIPVSTNDIPNHATVTASVSRTATNTPFPPPVITQHSHKFESVQSAPYQKHPSPFFLDPQVETPLKSNPYNPNLQAASGNNMLNGSTNMKKSSNPFPYTPNVDIRNSNMVNSSNSVTVPSSSLRTQETPSKLQTNVNEETEGNLIDISPAIKKEYASSINNGEGKENSKSESVNKELNSDNPSISDLKKPKKPARPLQFSFNEMNLSQESSLISGTLGSRINMEEADGDEELGESVPSIASSESIELNLEDRRKSKEPVKKDSGRSKQTNPDKENLEEKNDKVPGLPLRDRSEITKDLRQNRHSLDLELQEVIFSNNRSNQFSNSSTTENTKNSSKLTVASTPLSFNSNSHGASGSSLSVESIDHIRNSRGPNLNNHSHYSKSNHQNQMNHLGRNTRAEQRTKNDFAHVRQSLDVERIRKESLLGGSSGNGSSTGINSKRKSFFSIFKNDKK
ncbi:serine/threonine-protein kinase Akl1p [Monosporozyma servazzii]